VLVREHVAQAGQKAEDDPAQGQAGAVGERRLARHGRMGHELHKGAQQLRPAVELLGARQDLLIDDLRVARLVFELHQPYDARGEAARLAAQLGQVARQPFEGWQCGTSPGWATRRAPPVPA